MRKSWQMSCAEAVHFHGMPAIAWRSRDGARAVATLQGAHLVSWTLPGGEEGLFVSERSAFATGRAIRGGIPVIFPQFADRGPLVQHGFARTQAWRFAAARGGGAGERELRARAPSARTLALWPHAFRLDLVAAIGASSLEVRLRVVNTGRDALSFAAALHSYLRVADAASARLSGLRGVRYLTRGERETAVEGASPSRPRAEPIDRTFSRLPP